LVKLDLGCGPKKLPDHLGIDRIPFPGVDRVFDMGCSIWPFVDASVDGAHCCHALEHLTARERVHFTNELYRVLVPKGSCTLIVPHWASCRAYGDPTHQWPPVSEFWFFYLGRAWRADNAPHTDIKHWSYGFDCDFEVTWGYNLNPSIATRSQDFQQFAVSFYKEAAMDIHATMTKR
jgi:ubiquinone/menaquinone biosynthesis C-methylase UbiE